MVLVSADLSQGGSAARIRPEREWGARRRRALMLPILRDRPRRRHGRLRRPGPRPSRQGSPERVGSSEVGPAFRRGGPVGKTFCEGLIGAATTTITVAAVITIITTPPNPPSPRPRSQIVA